MEAEIGVVSPYFSRETLSNSVCSGAAKGCRENCGVGGPRGDVNSRGQLGSFNAQQI